MMYGLVERQKTLDYLQKRSYIRDGVIYTEGDIPFQMAVNNLEKYIEWEKENGKRFNDNP